MSHMHYGIAPQLGRVATAAAYCGSSRRGVGGRHEHLGAARPSLYARLAPGRDRSQWPTWNPHSQIDHILVQGAVRPVAGVVFPHSGSDHRPIRAELEIG